MSKLEYAVAVLRHCNLFNNNYQQESTVSCIFIPNKQFGPLTTISLHSLTMLNITNT